MFCCVASSYSTHRLFSHLIFAFLLRNVFNYKTTARRKKKNIHAIITHISIFCEYTNQLSLNEPIKTKQETTNREEADDDDDDEKEKKKQTI